MRIKGKLIGAPKPRYCVIEREDVEFVFTINAVLDYSKFDELCPMPSPPKSIRPGGATSVNTEDPRYLESLTKYSEKKTSWLMIMSLKETEGLEWENIDLEDPETWKEFKDELTSSGLTESEAAHLINEVYLANSLDESKMNEARDRFLRSQEAASK